MQIMELSQRQKKRFEKQVRELLKDENAKDAITLWDGTILWDLKNKASSCPVLKGENCGIN